MNMRKGAAQVAKTTDERSQSSERSYISGVVLEIGPISCLGNLYTLLVPNADKDEKLRSVCPECDTPTEHLMQRLHCVNGHGPFERADVKWGQKNGDGQIICVETEQVEAARTSQRPEKSFELRVHRRDDVMRHTFFGERSYVFRPTGNSKLAGVLVDLLKQRPDLCLVSAANMRKRDHLVMVDVALNDQLIVRDLIWPEDMKAQPVMSYTYEKKHFDMAVMLVDATVEDFDPDEYPKEARVRVKEMVVEAAGNVQPAKTTRGSRAKKTDDDDLTKALEAAIAQANKNKTKKKAS